MSKIKSIKIIKDFPLNMNFKQGKVFTYEEFKNLTMFIGSKYSNLEITDMILAWSGFFEVEYESEPKFLKRPDKSIISEPEEGQEVAFILITKDVNSFVAGSRFCLEKDKFLLRTGKIFLIIDKYEAEKKARMLTKQLEITNEIERLNAEQGWVADWGSGDQEKHNFIYNHSYTRIDLKNCWEYQSGVLYSSEEILDKIQNKYSEDELKQFLGIII